FWDDIIGEYMAWKGRYFGIFVTVLFHRSGSMIENYPYPLFLFLVLLFGAFIYFVRSAFEEKVSAIRLLFSALALGVFYIITIPKASASLYWADGAFQYHVGSIFYLLAIAALFKLFRERQSPLLPTLLSIFFIFAAIGSTEIFMVALFSLVSLIFLYKFFFLQENRIAWSVVLAVTIISTLILVLSPGNAIRMDLQPLSGQFWFALGHSFYYGIETIWLWLSRPLFLLFTILFIPVALHLVFISGIRRKASWIRLGLMLALLLGQMWVSFFATWWAGATHPPGRTQNTIYLVFLLGWFMFILEFVAVLSKQRKLVYVESLFSKPVRIAIIIVTFTTGFYIVTDTYVSEAYKALAGSAKNYDRVMNSRYAYIELQKKLSSNSRKLSVRLESIENPPRILVFSDISRNKKDWPNTCVATYFGIATVERK
ncbi:MAG: DUF6056 family protein, partial [Candidatus Scalindua sp.]